PGLAIGCRRNQFPFPAAPAAFLPDPAASHGFAVAGTARQQKAAPRPAAIAFDAPEVGGLEVANRILPEQVGLLLRKDRRIAGRFRVPPATQGDTVKTAIILAIHGAKREAGLVVAVGEIEIHADKVKSLDAIPAQTQAHAGRRTPAVR